MQLPLDTPLRDEQEKPTTLRECIAGKPTILVPMYYRCPMNCHRVVKNLVETLREMAKNNDYTVGNQFNVICFSFDPKEHSGDASRYKDVTVGEYGVPGSEKGWHFLTGTKESVAEVMGAIGFRAELDKAYKEYNHPNGIIVLSPRREDDALLLRLRLRRRDQTGRRQGQAGGWHREGAHHHRAALLDRGRGREGGLGSRQARSLCYRVRPPEQGLYGQRLASRAVAAL